ncbi:MAG: asparaginase [Pseudomonadota bacterium]
MTQPVPFAQVWRGAFLESQHLGHAVICDDTGQIVEAWGDPDLTVLPRSSAKMIQALPLIRSGAAAALSLTPEHLALACASHQGAVMHTNRVEAWLSAIGCHETALRCGPQAPNDLEARDGLIRGALEPCQIHNNCSGKHTGFLTLAQHLGAGPNYIAPDHPVQRACLEEIERTSGQTSPGHAIDGCSAPNFALTLTGLARAMAHFAAAPAESAETQLHQAMRRHPELVAGEGRACTELMHATDGKVALKTGAEGVFVAILPEKRMGVALKAACGTTRAAECAITALLARLKAIDPKHPAARKRMNAPIRNWRGIETGSLRPSAELWAG